MVDESSQTRESGVWTGTLVNGQPALGSEFCKDWDDDSGLLKFGGTGLSMNTDAPGHSSIRAPAARNSVYIASSNDCRLVAPSGAELCL
jgi:hypothetical protein